MDLCRILHNHNLPSNDDSGHVVIRSPVIADSEKAITYLYPFLTSEEVPETFRDIHSSGFCVWDTRAMRAVVRPNIPASAPRADFALMRVECCAPASNVEIVEVQDSKDVYDLMTPVPAAHLSIASDYAGKIVLDDHETGKKVSLLPFNRNSYEREEIWLTTYQVVEVCFPLRADSRKHAEKFMKSLKTDTYQQSPDLMTLASHVSGRFKSMKLAHMLEWRGKDRFLRSNFSLVISDGRHRCSCIRKLADSGEAGNKWALQPIRVTLIKFPGSEILTDHEVLSLSRSTNVICELVLRPTSMVDIIKSLFQYR